MKSLEALIDRLPGANRPWSAQKGFSKLAELEGSVIDLPRVLASQALNHAHYRPAWHPDQPVEPDELKSTISSLLSQNEMDLDKCHGTIRFLYEDYFREHGIESIIPGIYPPTDGSKDSAFELLVTPNPSPWPIAITIALFPWVDFQVEFVETRKARAKRNPDQAPLWAKFAINSSKTNGNLYKVEIAAPEEGLTPVGFKNHGLKLFERFNAEATDFDMDNFVIQRESQTLVKDLLAARTSKF